MPSFLPQEALLEQFGELMEVFIILLMQILQEQGVNPHGPPKIRGIMLLSIIQVPYTPHL